MLSKGTTAYERVRESLGIPYGLEPNIPRKVLSLDAGRTATIKDAVRRMLERGMGADEMTMVICQLCEEREHVYDAAHDEGRLERAFFVVSELPLRRENVYLPRCNVLMFKGGLCLQQIHHYHYVFTVEWSAQARDVRIGWPNARDALMRYCNVTPVVTNTHRCLEYISAQCARVEDDSMPGYADDEYYCWGAEPTADCERTNDTGNGGKWCGQLKNREMVFAELRAKDLYKRSVHRIVLRGGLVANPREYRGEHYIIFSGCADRDYALRLLGRIKHCKARAVIFE